MAKHNFKINFFSFLPSKNYDLVFRKSAVIGLMLEEKRGKYSFFLLTALSLLLQTLITKGAHKINTYFLRG